MNQRPGPGHPRTYANNAERQKAYRERARRSLDLLPALYDALCDACDAGRSPGLMDRLGDDWIPELISRLGTKKLIVCRRSTNEEPKST